MGAALGSGTRREPAALLPLVPGCTAQHMLECARPPRRGRPRRPSGTARSPGRSTASPTASCATRVARLAGVLASLGVSKSDRVLIYMPMVPEMVIAMLACARIGAVHSVVSAALPRTSSPRASTTPSRGSSCRPRAASRSTGSSLTSRCSRLRSPRRAKPEHCVILQRTMCRADLMAGSDHDWHELIVIARPADCRLG